MAEVERSWFRERAAGQRVEFRYDDPSNIDSDFDDVADADADADLADFRAELPRADAAIAALSLDHEFEARGTRTLRWAYLHMIEEYARHNGHADLLRERIDGKTGD